MIQTDHLVTRYLSWPLLNCWPLPCWVFHGLRLPVGLCHVGSFIASGYLLASATLYLSWAPISCWPLPRCNFPGLWLAVGLGHVVVFMGSDQLLASATLCLLWVPVTCWPRPRFTFRGLQLPVGLCHVVPLWAPVTCWSRDTVPFMGSGYLLASATLCLCNILISLTAVGWLKLAWIQAPTPSPCMKTGICCRI